MRLIPIKNMHSLRAFNERFHLLDTHRSKN